MKSKSTAKKAAAPAATGADLTTSKIRADNRPDTVPREKPAGSRASSDALALGTVAGSMVLGALYPTFAEAQDREARPVGKTDKVEPTIAADDREAPTESEEKVAEDDDASVDPALGGQAAEIQQKVDAAHQPAKAAETSQPDDASAPDESNGVRAASTQQSVTAPEPAPAAKGQAAQNDGSDVQNPLSRGSAEIGDTATPLSFDGIEVATFGLTGTVLAAGPTILADLTQTVAPQMTGQVVAPVETVVADLATSLSATPASLAATVATTADTLVSPVVATASSLTSVPEVATDLLPTAPVETVAASLDALANAPGELAAPVIATSASLVEPVAEAAPALVSAVPEVLTEAIQETPLANAASAPTEVLETVTEPIEAVPVIGEATAELISLDPAGTDEPSTDSKPTQLTDQVGSAVGTAAGAIDLGSSSSDKSDSPVVESTAPTGAVTEAVPVVTEAAAETIQAPLLTLGFTGQSYIETTDAQEHGMASANGLLHGLV